MGWIDVRGPREQVAAEGGDADGGYDRAPGREEEPCGIGEKRITDCHDGRSILRVLYLTVIGIRNRCRREAGQRGLALGCFRELLLRGRRSLVHVALHAGFMLGY